MRLILTMALAAMMAFTLKAANISGLWKGAMDTQGGAMGEAVTIQAGAGVAGDVKTDMAEGKIENGKLDGDQISFEITTDYGKLGFAGTMAGDEMKLTVAGPSGNKHPLVGKRSARPAGKPGCLLVEESLRRSLLRH